MTRPASNGSIIGAIQDPSPTSAGGIWTLPAQYELQKEGNWIAPGYNISRSLRFNSADTAYLNRTPSSTGNRRTYSHSFWLKRGDISRIQWVFSVRQASGSSNFFYEGIFYGDDTFSVQLRDGSGNEVGNIRTTQVFRDVSAWYHFLVVIDTTQATSSNRMKLYVNGSQVTAFGTATYPTQNFDSGANVSTYPFFHGNFVSSVSSTYNYSGYLADVHFIDGSALTPSSFGETDDDTGVWKPKAYTGSYGTNGFHLDFSDNSSTTALGYDAAGSNDWTPNNFSVTAGAGNDSLVDTPTPYGTDTGAGGEVRGNYATWNSLVVNKPVLTNGNLDADGSDLKTAISTMGVSSGKWYWEISIGSGTNTPNMGVTSYANDKADPGVYLGTGRSYVSGGGGGVYKNYTATSTGANTNFSDGNTAGAVIGFALDCDAGTLAYYVNNVLRQTDSTIATGTLLYPMTCNFNSTTNAYRNTSVNFGQRPFAYTAPSGFKALCTQNLPEPTVVQGDDYFNTVLWTGDGNATKAITGVGFQPDLVWNKARSSTAPNMLNDAVRGTNKYLSSNTTDAEVASSGTWGYLSAFDSDGFTVTKNGNGYGVNESGATYVAWNWKANGSGSSNTDGTVTSTVSANTTSGFSIVTYTNASSGTVGHGLGVAPKMVIYKDRITSGNNWVVLHTALGNMTGSYLTLNTTNAVATGLGLSAEPTSTVISTSTALGGSGNAFVAYCFAPVAGFSAFGSYTGNGSADGPFVYTGFRPAFVLVKASNTTSNWIIFDDRRSGFNVNNDQLYPNLSNAEDAGGTSAQFIDLLSNGFKFRNTAGDKNGSGYTYIYAAFAENPFKYSLAR